MRFTLTLPRVLTTALALAALGMGCSSGSLTDARVMSLKLALDPAFDTLFLSAVPAAVPPTLKVTATATSMGNPIDLPSGRLFESANAAIVTIDQNGLVTGRGIGTTTVSVRVNDERTSSTIVVLPMVRSLTLSAAPTQALVGDTIVLTTALLGWSSDTVTGQPITYGSSSPSAVVSSSGRVVFTAPGTAIITATSGPASANVTLTALPRDFIGGSSFALATGQDATCGLAPLGRTFCFGKAPLIGVARDTVCFDQSASGASSSAPCTLIGLQIAASVQFTALAVGDAVACGVVAGGSLYCWGDQTYGAVGNGVSKPGTSALPVPVTGPLTQAATFTQVIAGSSHVCALTTGGQAYCWGKDISLQLGGGDSSRTNASTPIPVYPNYEFTFRALAAGRGHTCGIRSDGVTLCWGDNFSGQLGRGTFGDTTDAPVAIVGDPGFTQISARGDNTCGITAAGALYCWGANESGQTGQAPSLRVTVPTQVAGAGYTAVAVGGRDATETFGAIGHVCALQGSAAVCWGSNVYGQLGRGGLTSVASSSPAPVAGGHAFTSITAGTRTACGMAADGVYCWGSTIFGATGNQIQAVGITTPRRVAPLQ
ncbi:MAG TPA: Ig-like domain-containing protein [Gemmatimonadaceae bacterium]